MIYLGQLTSSPSLTAESEDLEGIAAAQRELIKANDNRNAPLLRIIVANAGPEVRYGTATLAMLKPVVEADPSIIGMIGLDESRRHTVQVVQNLNELGLPVIATSLSADGLNLVSPLYFQIAPPNHEEAELIATAVAIRHCSTTPRPGARSPRVPTPISITSPTMTICIRRRWPAICGPA